METKKYFIIDFDSTFVKGEGLDQFAEIVLRGNPKMVEIVRSIKQLTTLGMEGKISFEESLKKRLRLIKGTRKDIEKNVRRLKKNISVSIKRNKEFFKLYRDNIFIISGGFEEFIIPITSPFGIPKDHVLANRFVFNKQGQIVGCDEKNPLAHSNGKVKVIKSLKLKGKIYVIGDGHTDYLIKKAGLATKFIAFTENIAREAVINKADIVAPSFDEFLFINKLPASISYPKNRIKVLLLEGIDDIAVRNFENEGYSVESLPKTFSEDELIEKLETVRILGIRSRTRISKRVVQSHPHLLTIGAFCIGTDQIDLESCAKNGISVFNAPYSNTRSVVEMILGEIIMLSRNVFDKSQLLHKGVWNKSAKNSFEIRGKTLGIIGYGNIGSQLSILAEAMGMRVLFYDVVERLPLGNAEKCKDLKDLLGKSDIISVHVDGSVQNKNMISKKEFARMKEGVIFLNASRGFVVDPDSLSSGIMSGKIKGAAIDVFPNEPQNKQDIFSSALQNLPNTILTPHIAGSTVEAQKNIGDFVSRKLVEYMNTGNTFLSVNFPNIQLPKQGHYHRLLHVHHNKPGVLSNINRVLAENKINIEGQYLKTNETVGYVITDVDKKYEKKVLKKMREIPDTIRFRVLY